jgi:hypothetical protein
MAELPVDERGYVIPWFVDYVDGKPEFRAMNLQKFVRAIKEKLCWVCGGRLGIHLTFVAGPMCGINRTSSEPPSHRVCAEWSAVNCPFLSNPRMVRREDDLSAEIRENMAGFGIKRNPGVTMLWHTRGYEIFRVETGNGVLITMGEPESVAWYCEGRPATRAEVLESVESGLPNLLEIARLEKGGIEHLDRARARFEKWLPL